MTIEIRREFMKTSRICTLLLLSAAAFSRTTVQGQANQPFSLTIAAKKSIIIAGSRLELKVRLTNISNHEIIGSVTYAGGTIINYQCDLRDSTGAPVQKKEHITRSGPSIPAELSARIRTLQPGESVEDGTFACKEFNMSQPGEYTVQLSEPISGNSDDGIVKSNIITITVVDPEAPVAEPR